MNNEYVLTYIPQKNKKMSRNLYRIQDFPVYVDVTYSYQELTVLKKLN